ncbi:uncharacterized protein [Macrobrachium rosenbergii]|uniref:uncharacterized protein n=1 Tax=Macrobrachium rosenbergii TaxID=79674 RepID=UPI0034D5D58B
MMYPDCTGHVGELRHFLEPEACLVSQAVFDLMEHNVLLLVTAVAAAPVTDSLDYVDPNPSYSMAWEVKDASTYLDKSHSQVLRDGTVEGQYSYLRPDGKLQVVTYTANKDTGFVANVELVDVMPPFGEAGNPASSAGHTSHNGRSFSHSSIDTSPSSSSGFSALSNGRSLHSGSSSGGHSVTPLSHLNNFGSRTFEQARTHSVTAAPAVHNITPNAQSTFFQHSPASQPSVFTPAIHRASIENSSSFKGNIAQNDFRSVAAVPNVHSQQPIATLHRSLPVLPTPASHGRSFSGSSDRTNVESLRSGVAHVTFNSPTHQYSYPLDGVSLVN